MPLRVSEGMEKWRTGVLLHGALYMAEFRKFEPWLHEVYGQPNPWCKACDTCLVSGNAAPSDQ